MHPSAPHQLITQSSAKSVARPALLASLIGLSVGLAACAEAPDPIPGAGGTASGGAASGGAASGGAASGGAASGGAASGGAASGGAASGGAASGGAASGGAASGGAASGGAGTGGAGTGGAGTGGTGTGGNASTVAFEDVTDILTMRCAVANCHGTPNPGSHVSLINDAGLHGRLTTFMAEQCGNGVVVIPNDSAGSSIVKLIKGMGCTPSMGSGMLRMPAGGAAMLPADEIETIEAWIDAGAPE